MAVQTLTSFQQIALLLTAIWLALVAVRFRRSYFVLIAGLLTIGTFTLAALASGRVTLDQLGLGAARAWLPTIGFALVWLVLMLACSPLADRLASRWIKAAPTLEAFRTIQQSTGKLIAGVLAAWALGGILEELVFRGIVLRSTEIFFSRWFIHPIAAGLAVCIAALGAGIIHFYQGPRAVVIIIQLSILFGVLFVLSGNNLWAVILCHGLYDTIAFIRFARKKSKYSDIPGI